MSTNATEFKLGIREFVDQSDERRRELTKVVALRGLRDVVLGTRVDTGRARGNWQVAEATPPEGEIERLDPSGGATLADGSSKIAAASGDEVVWIHNGVPYIGVLETWDGMVSGTYEALRTYLRSLG